MKDYLGYKGKTCVVHGGATGMGHQLLLRLVDLGCEKIYNLDIVEVPVEGVEFIQCDLAKKESIDAAFAQLPDTFDKFFGCAGVSGLKHSFVDTVAITFLSNKYITDTYLLDRVVENGTIAYLASQGAGPYLETKDEYIDLINTKTWEEGIEWLENCIKEYPGARAYYMAKRAMAYYPKTKVWEFGSKKGIRINTVSPCGTKTPIFNEFTEKLGDPAIQALYRGAIDRYAEAHEQAEPLIAISSDLCTYVSGQNLIVDFGSTGMEETGSLPDPSIRQGVFTGSALGLETPLKK